MQMIVISHMQVDSSQGKGKIMSSAPYRVVFVRHGESEWNSLNLFCGWHDAELSDKGKCDQWTDKKKSPD
uniref:phosphoglycerate mutase (2,3-diphosphoglycerate-dependent) n=1 Tax=Phlebotomus papatasi TaxID=29031 RepID=A0A1B0EYF1_PHLPP